MKKRLPFLLCICFLLFSILFFCLWQQAKVDRSDIESLAQGAARNASAAFAQYGATGSESDWWDGVAEFRSMQNAYTTLVSGTNKQPNYLFMNEVYGSLLLYPDRCRPHTQEITAVLDLLAADIHDLNGHHLMSCLRNTLSE